VPGPGEMDFRDAVEDQRAGTHREKRTDRELCSKIFLPQLVKRALPGMALTHLPVPPRDSGAGGLSIFSVSRNGPCWDHIVQTRRWPLCAGRTAGS